MPGVNGILLVDKPAGPTSADVIRALKKNLGRKTKIGHLGTLDPFASGLLPVCLGTGTKIAQFLLIERKSYTGTIRLGSETDTLDATGTVTHSAQVSSYDSATLHDLEQRFCGKITQTPPMYSALKKNGVPLYRLARQGIIIEREPRQIIIHDLRLQALARDILQFSLSCSKGTYVRTLAADIGTSLGCGAHLLTLRRTAFGPFSIEEARTLAQLSAQTGPDAYPVLSLSSALCHYPVVTLSDRAVGLIRRGQQAVLQELSLPSASHPMARLVAQDGTLIALAEQRQGRWRLARVI